MRVLAPLVGLMAVLALVLLVFSVGGGLGRRRMLRQRDRARWRPRHYADRGQTVVAVGLTLPGGEVVEEHVVDRFADNDPDWERKFLHAREEAERRAFHLNAE